MLPPDEPRRDRAYLQRLAMRDLTDVHLHPELPDITELVKIEPPREIIHRYSDMSAKEFDTLEQTKLKVDYLEKQLKELSKPKKKPETKYGYRGIR